MPESTADQPTAQATFDALVTQTVWPFLREQGFARRRGTFHRSRQHVWEVVNLQKSMNSHAGRVRFTVNLALAPGGGDAPPPVARCAVSERLGFLLDDGIDTWWDIYPDSDPLGAGRPIVDALADHGLPWLEQRRRRERGLRVAGLVRGVLIRR